MNFSCCKSIFARFKVDFFKGDNAVRICRKCWEMRCNYNFFALQFMEKVFLCYVRRFQSQKTKPREFKIKYSLGKMPHTFISHFLCKNHACQIRDFQKKHHFLHHVIIAKKVKKVIPNGITRANFLGNEISTPDKIW